ncbi:PAS domain-containing sensor histidine kinase, partial [Aeromonas finlandensis]|uniref:PAS domain-containing sensor histidine kinase n=1 Tax=Aeromonas finlandensis TaxID=1543375 RepID=UPI001F4CBDD0
RLARVLKYKKKAEIKLLSQLDMMQEFIDGIPHPVVLLDSNLCIKFCNRSFNKAFEIEVDADVKYLDSLISDEDCDSVLKTIKSAFYFGKVLTRETSITILGKPKDIQDWFIPYNDVNDGSRGIFWGWFDVTWRNEAYTAAMQSSAEAEQANKAKSEFIATISHEIRTPLNIINGFLEIFSHSPSISMSEREELSYMRSASHNLLELVGDVLDVTKIESGLLTIENEAVDIYTLLRNSAEMFYLMASKKGVRILEEYHLDSSNWFMLDPLRVRQVFYNVLSNAVKFTDDGTIKILVSYINGHLHVRVTDTGIGISDEKLGCLFKPFIQAHT